MTMGRPTAWLNEDDDIKVLQCPRCGRDLKRLTKMVEDATVLRCKPCGIFGAYTEGIAMRWREKTPDLAQLLERDLDEGERMRHMLTSDVNDPMWSAW
jgi:predicted RNA-binding Zn-ribbon protein involved in translation (DUF1610 family)